MGDDGDGWEMGDGWELTIKGFKEWKRIACAWCGSKVVAKIEKTRCDTVKTRSKENC